MKVNYHLQKLPESRDPMTKMDDYFKICEVLNISPVKLLIEDNQECETLVEKIYALSERDFRLVATMVELM